MFCFAILNFLDKQIFFEHILTMGENRFFSICFFIPELLFLFFLFFFIFLTLIWAKFRAIFYSLWGVVFLALNLIYFLNSFFLYGINTNFFFFNGLIFIDFYSICTKLILICLIMLNFFFFKVYNNLYVNLLSPLPIILLGFILFLFLVLLSTTNLFLVYLIFEILTFVVVTLYSITANTAFSIEAGLKYFYLNAVSSAFFLFSLLILHFSFGTLDLILLRFQLIEPVSFVRLFCFFIFFLFGLLFKLSVFPCALWAPDVYEGLSFIFLFFFSVILKVCYFFVFLRILIYLIMPFVSFWFELLFVAAWGSILFGAFGALAQTRFKRFIAYTSINQMGFLIFSLSISFQVLALNSFFLYLAIYIFANFLFFYSILTTKNIFIYKYAFSSIFLTDIIFGLFCLKFFYPTQYFGVDHLLPAHWADKNLIFFSLALFIYSGLPPVIGFFSKFYLYLQFFTTSYFFIIFFLILLSTTISVFYYIRLLKLVWFEIFSFGNGKCGLFTIKLAYPQNSWILSLNYNALNYFFFYFYKLPTAKYFCRLLKSENFFYFLLNIWRFINSNLAIIFMMRTFDSFCLIIVGIFPIFLAAIFWINRVLVASLICPLFFWFFFKLF